ncbi:MAG: ATP-binding cassette domain-containing protein [SAR202 cluster bacterium]|nr:ATP-binding cassette domain-containing protein [SAR202 cluster bacterium]
MTTTETQQATQDTDGLAIEVQNVTKLFGERRAVDDVTFRIRKGEIVGFLGPNGSGKTTTMRMLTSYYSPDVGRIKIKGIDTQEKDITTREFIGYLPENNPLYGDLLVKEYLDFVADVRGLKGARRRENIASTVDEAGLQEYYYRPVSTLSKGYRQRTGLAGAILHRPDILIMDEPTEGLDPNQRVTIRELIRNLGRDRTIMLSTHVLQEIEGTCDRLLVINKGKLIADDPVKEISKRVKGARAIHVEVQGKDVEAALAKLDGVAAVHAQPSPEGRLRFILDYSGDADPRPQVFQLAKKRDWVLWELHEVEARLQDIFHALTVEQQAPKPETHGPSKSSEDKQ